jgi:hypothetical protein
MFEAADQLQENQYFDDWSDIVHNKDQEKEQ